ncbi:hypothetical protein PSCICO_47060 [Pseudomonas cichorii]|uniref:hypothetical protein n=1 Tax=Pseudomonas cichorii TaxID=36746 RepID=UPI0019106B3D|nr:hypothetical protein [Pseudomonas cichorii]GFM89307.1 hypothetical protein PSCICO_47060 [Pseudomonas cichorii]
MQSSVYVPGVSGWKIKFGKDFVEFHRDSRDPVRIGNLDEAPSPKAEPKAPDPKPFIVVDGVTYISGAEVERQTIAKLKLAQGWSVKAALLDGRYVFTGVGVGPRSQVSADQFVTDADSVADVVRKVLREELRPGGLLHRRV